MSPSDEKTKPKEKEIKAPLHPKPTVTKKQIQLKNEEIKKSQQKNEISNVDSNVNVINQNGKDVVKKVVNNVVKKKEVVKTKENISPADNRRDESKSETVTKVPTPEKPVTEEKPAEGEANIPSEDLLIDVGVSEVVNGQAQAQQSAQAETPLVPEAVEAPAVVPVAPAQAVLVPETVEAPAVVPEAPAPTTIAHAAVLEPPAVPVPVEEPRAAAVPSTDTDGEPPKGMYAPYCRCRPGAAFCHQ